MQDIILKMLIGMIVSRLDLEAMGALRDKLDELYRDKSDDALDYIEDYIKASKTKVDDKLLPLIDTYRVAFKIPR